MGPDKDAGQEGQQGDGHTYSPLQKNIKKLVIFTGIFAAFNCLSTIILSYCLSSIIFSRKGFRN